MNELHAINNWIYDTLTADAQIQSAIGNKVFFEEMPAGKLTGQDNNYPAILYSLQTSDDNQGLGTVRLLTRLTYWIRVITKGRPTTQSSLLSNRIDEIMGKSVTRRVTAITGEEYYVSSRRLRPLAYSQHREQTTDVFYHMGGLYRMEVVET